MREIQIETNINKYAEGSVLIKVGNTHVLCTASVDEGVPGWMKGTGKGWVTAEYSMLPRSTHTRTKREREKVGGRTHEIQRLIARALRACVDLQKLGERQIIVDCDVIQADGGTRCASITGGCVALGIAIQKLVKEQKIPADAWMDTVSAISVGVHEGKVLVDLDYDKDSTCDVDMNFVRMGKGGFVEVQGTGEKATFSAAQLNEMLAAAEKALDSIKTVQETKLK